ncbi:MAG: PilZ domain-containing protein [Sulfuricurvum sp.]|nr:PilZ domain-containing protein [Sulfuricurvum sp.]
MANKLSLGISNSSISHRNFDINAFRPIFIKAAWKAYTEIESKPVTQSRFLKLIGSLFDTFFSDNTKELEKNVHDIRKLLVDQIKIERFLSDTFYIVMNYYIKSFYGSVGGWEKIVAFSTAIERFIAYSASHLGNESFFIFEDALINTLENLRQRSEAIMVLNTYYGVPVQYPAHIIHTDSKSVVIKVHPLQEKAAILQSGIYILKNGQLINDVYASVSPTYINGERYLELSRFDQLKTSLYHRQSIRVHPHEPYTLIVTHPSLTIRSLTYDISIGGIALTSLQPIELPIPSNVKLLFPAEIMGSTRDVHGRLVYQSTYEGGYKYHFKITPSLHQEKNLEKYIARREQEIIKQLREETV